MAEQNEKQNDVKQIVEHAVAQALEAQLPQLQAQIARQVLEALPAATGAASAQAGESASGLVQAVANIHAGSTQKEILRALLDAGGGYCSRIALFVVKAGAASGWQSRGFGNDEGIKDFSLDLNAGPVAHTYQNRTATPGNIAEMGKAFVEQFGAPANEQVLVLPLALKEKVAALVYADGGDGGKLDSASLELLVMATSAWLEVASLRKQATAKDDAAASNRAVSAAAAPVQTVSSFSDPFASHSPKHSPAAAQAEAEPAAEVVEVATAHCQRGGGAGNGDRSPGRPFAGRCRRASESTAVRATAGR